MFLFDEAGFVQTQDLPLGDLWLFFPIGYLITILIETPILITGLPKPVSLKQRLLSGIWLTACTYPIVVLVLPAIFYGQPRALYLVVAEIFAPVAECLLFWLFYRGRVELTNTRWFQAFAAIVIANLASFGIGELLHNFGFFG